MARQCNELENTVPLYSKGEKAPPEISQLIEHKKWQRVLTGTAKAVSAPYDTHTCMIFVCSSSTAYGMWDKTKSRATSPNSTGMQEQRQKVSHDISEPRPVQAGPFVWRPWSVVHNARPSGPATDTCRGAAAGRSTSLGHKALAERPPCCASLKWELKIVRMFHWNCSCHLTSSSKTAEVASSPANFVSVFPFSARRQRLPRPQLKRPVTAQSSDCPSQKTSSQPASETFLPCPRRSLICCTCSALASAALSWQSAKAFDLSPTGRLLIPL